MGLMVCPEVWVWNYHTALHKIAEECRARVHCSGSLKSWSFSFVLIILKQLDDFFSFKILVTWVKKFLSSGVTVRCYRLHVVCNIWGI